MNDGSRLGRLLALESESGNSEDTIALVELLGALHRGQDFRGFKPCCGRNALCNVAAIALFPASRRGVSGCLDPHVSSLTKRFACLMVALQTVGGVEGLHLEAVQKQRLLLSGLPKIRVGEAYKVVTVRYVFVHRREMRMRSEGRIRRGACFPLVHSSLGKCHVRLLCLPLAA